MNINQLYSNLVKKANMKKVAGPNAARLRKLIEDFNRVRNDSDLVYSLKQIASTSPNILEKSLSPFYLPNPFNSTMRVLNTFKSPYTHADKDLNKFIDRINDAIMFRKSKIRDLGGYAVAKAFDKSLLDKYLIDKKPYR